MAIAIRTARTTWEGPLASGTGMMKMGSGAARSACYAMALALRLDEHKATPERLAITATVTLDEAGGIPTIVSSHLGGTARVPRLDKSAFDAVIGEATELCPVSRLFAGAKITVDAALEPAP